MPSAAGLYYFAHEAENYARPPAILIHGAGGSHLSWPAQVRRIPNQRIFAVDLPAHGKSGGIGHHRIQDYAKHLRDFINVLGLRAAILIGHSMGSAIALSLAVHSPGQVLGLGLLGGGARLRVNPDLLQRASNPSTFVDTVRTVVDYSFSLHAGKRLKELAAQRMAETRPTVLYGDLMACDAFNITNQVAPISVPTLILCGAEDKMTPLSYSESLRDQIRSAGLTVVPNAGHMLMLEQPDLTATYLNEFLTGIRYQPGQ